MGLGFSHLRCSKRKAFGVKRLTVRLPDDILQELTAEAKRRGCRVPDIARERLGRPAPPPAFQGPAEPREIPKTVYLGRQELAHIEELAKRRGLGVSAFFRTLALGHRLPPALSVFSKIRLELARHGNNLNQLTAAAHEIKRRGGFPSAELVLETLGEIKQAWVAAGEKLDSQMADFEDRFQ